MNLSETTIKELHDLYENMSPMDHSAFVRTLKDIYMGPREKPMFIVNLKEDQRRMFPFLMKRGIVTRMASEETYEKDRNALNYVNVHMNMPEAESTYELCDGLYDVRCERSIVENSPQFDDITVENRIIVSPRSDAKEVAIYLEQKFDKVRAHLDAVVAIQSSARPTDDFNVIYKERFDTNHPNEDDLCPLVFVPKAPGPEIDGQSQLTLVSYGGMKTGFANDALEHPLTRLDVTATGRNAITVQLHHGDQYESRTAVICTIVREYMEGTGTRLSTKVIVPSLHDRRSWTL